MTKHNSKVETIVNALLQVSDSVVEVSRAQVFTRIWNAPGVSTGNLNSYLGKKVADINNDSIFKHSAERIERAFETGKNDYLEYTAPINNVNVTYSIRIVVIHPDPDFLFVVLKNISQKEGEKIIEDKWKLALDAAGDGMWDANLETGKIFFSARWHELFGYDASDFDTTVAWKTKIHPEDLEKTEKAIADHVEGRSPFYSVEVRYLCKDGTYKWILSKGVVISRTREGKPLRFIGTHTDINEQKIAEDKYHESAQLLSKLLDSLNDGIAVTNEEREIIFANQRFCDIYKIDAHPSELVGTSKAQGIGMMRRETVF